MRIAARAMLLAACDDGDSGQASVSTATSTVTPVATSTATATPTASPEARITYSLVTVDDPGNEADGTGYGAVAYTYRIGVHEVTIGQYTAFLNAIAARDLHQVYTPRMGGDTTVAGILRSGAEGEYRYAVTGPAGITPPGAGSGSERPIAYVSWFAAARFANWMANGQPTGEQDESTTEDGAYALHGAVTGDAPGRNHVNPNTGGPPAFSLPTEDEWYKAAYFSPARHGGAGGYYLFATQSDTAPGNVLGDEPNQANFIADATGYSIYSVGQLGDLDPSQNYLSDVGAFTANASAYGTFDQNGNLWEWNDGDGAAAPYRILRGAAWTSTIPYLKSTLRLGYTPAGQTSNGGFRLAAPAASSGTATRALAVRAPAVVAPDARQHPGPSLPVVAPGVPDGGAAVTIEMVVVGDAGNPSDATGFGGVDYDFAIAVHDVTIGQYTAFLNAMAATDPHELYHPSMATDFAIAGIARAGEPGSFTYSVMENDGSSGDRPITFVSWWDAARFANWMANGQPAGEPDTTSTEDGAYPVLGATAGVAPGLNAVNPNTGMAPAFRLPTEDEWYKAAHYDASADGGAGHYYRYATRSDDPPGNQVGDLPNQANYFNGVFTITRAPALEPNRNYLTDVGAFSASASYYGTFDQNGSVWEWNDLDGSPGPARGLRGGYWFSGSLALEASMFCNDTSSRESNDVGFRLAGPAPR